MDLLRLRTQEITAGLDIAPEPVGTEENHYLETLRFTAGGNVINAEGQELAVLHYRQTVQRVSPGNSVVNSR